MYDVVLLSCSDFEIDEEANHRDRVGQIIWWMRPIGSYRLRTHLERNGYSTKVLEYVHQLSEDKLTSLLDKYVSADTKVLGITSTFYFSYERDRYNSIMYQLERIKQKYPDIKIVLGGPSPSHIELDCVDVKINGYAENAIISLLEGNDDNLLMGTHQYGFPDEYDIIWKDEDVINSNEVLSMEVARGCIFQCAFCNYPLNGKKKFDYVRASNDIRDELLRNYENFGTTRYVFTDDTFNDSVYKLDVLYEALQGLPFQLGFATYIKPELLVRFEDQIDLLVELGLEHPSFGIETLNPESRKSVYKGCTSEEVLEALGDLKNKCIKRDNGLIYSSHGNMIVGLPYEDKETLLGNVEKIYASKVCDDISWFPLAITDKKKIGGYVPLSPVDLNPEKYGYRTGNIDLFPNLTNKQTIRPDRKMFWVNSTNGMTFQSATSIALEIYLKYEKTKVAAGFQVPSLWSANADVYSLFQNGDLDIWNERHRDLSIQLIRNMSSQIEKYYNHQINL